MKAIMQGAQSIMLGDADVVVAGGMESMSQVPFYSENLRWGNKYGNVSMIDGLAKDGLTDVYHNYAMGVAADMCATECKITREEQDAFAIESYKRSAAAWAAGKFNAEIVPVQITGRKGDVVTFSEDEEYKNVNFDKVPGLRAAFTKEGTVTAANERRSCGSYPHEQRKNGVTRTEAYCQSARLCRRRAGSGVVHHYPIVGPSKSSCQGRSQHV
jgi:acetyl-CoA C-acetyltransferase